MSTVDTDVIDALQSLGVDREKATKAAIAIYNRADAGGADFRTDVNTLKGDVAVLKSDVAVLKSDVTVLKSDVAILKSDVAVLKGDVVVLKSDVAVLKGDVVVLKSDVAVLKWMSGFTIALVAAIFLKLFLH